MADLVYATAHDVTTLEPTQVSGFGDHTAALAIFGALTSNFDGATGEVGYRSYLAERVVPRGDSAWEIRLRPGLSFHDGQPLDAAALKFSLDRIRAPGFPSKRFMRTAPIASVEVEDRLTCVLRTTELIAVLPARLLRADAYVVSPRHYGSDPATTAFRPVGAGPFRFESHAPGDRLILAVNEDFADPRGRARPNFDRLVLRVIADPDLLAEEMAAGRVDIAPVTAALAPGFAALPGVRVESAPDTTRLTFEINQRAHPALADTRVRRAICHAVDVPALLARLTGGAGERIATLVNPPNADPSVEPYPYDPARSRALLAEAGWPDGFLLDIDWSAGPDRGAAAEALVPYLEAVGIRVGAVRERDWATEYQPGQVAGTLAGLHGHGHAGVEMTAETDLWPIHPDREANATNWSGPAADRFRSHYGELQRTVDADGQRRLGHALQRIAHEEVVSLPLWRLPRHVAVGQRVARFRPYPGGHNEDFWTIRLTEEAEAP